MVENKYEYRHLPFFSTAVLVPWLTFLVMLIGIVFTSYLSLRSDIQAASDRAALIVGQINSRVVVLETHREAELNFQRDVRADLTRLTNMMTDIRIQIRDARKLEPPT